MLYKSGHSLCKTHILEDRVAPCLHKDIALGRLEVVIVTLNKHLFCNDRRPHDIAYDFREPM